MLATPRLLILFTALVAGSLATPVQAAPVAGAAPVRNFVLTSERVQSFGQFAAVEHAIVRPGAALHVYGEPGDFGWHRQDAGAKFKLLVGVDVRRRAGGAVVDRSQPLLLTHQAGDRSGDFFFSLSVTINAPVGLYTIDVTLRDPANGQSVAKSFLVHVSKQKQPSFQTDRVRGGALPPIAGSAERAPAAPVTCKKYFAQIGATVAVPCED